MYPPNDDIVDDLKPTDDLTDAGIDSLAAIELRNRLTDLTGTLIFHQMPLYC